jgi:hypothetical protein
LEAQSGQGVQPWSAVSVALMTCVVKGKLWMPFESSPVRSV